MNGSKRSYAPETKQMVVQMTGNGRKPGEIAKILGLDVRLVHQWIDRAKPGFVADQNQKERERRAKRARICPDCGKRTLVSPKATRCIACSRILRRKLAEEKR